MSTNGPVEQSPEGVAHDAPGGAAGQLTQITRAMVARTHYAGGNVVICVLEGTLTPVERSLANLGEQHRLQDLRQLFQSATEPTFRAVVEEITGRRVVSFMSGNDVRNDVASEIFVLEPTRLDEAVAE
jgi:uncharacterized protein YbcI